MAQGPELIPLTDEQIHDRFGSYLRDCIEALATDITYVERMAAMGSQIATKRERARRRKAARSNGSDADPRIFLHERERGRTSRTE